MKKNYVLTCGFFIVTMLLLSPFISIAQESNNEISNNSNPTKIPIIRLFRNLNIDADEGTNKQLAYITFLPFMFPNMERYEFSGTGKIKLGLREYNGDFYCEALFFSDKGDVTNRAEGYVFNGRCIYVNLWL